MASSAPSLVVAVLGAGSMGGAVARGVAASGTAGVIATNRSGQKAALLSDVPGIRSYALDEYPERNRLSAAEADGKLVLVDVWATWCKNCLTMDRTTLQDPAVEAALDDYVKIKFQAEDLGVAPASEVMNRFEAFGLPTYAILRIAPSDDSVRDASNN